MQNISFIIPVYNASDTLEETVRSVFNGNFYEGDEVIIIDDASTDPSAALAEKLQNEFKGITILKHRINKGSAAAGRNTGIDHAKHELIYCLDADNILLPGSVEQLKQFLISSGTDCVHFGEIHMFEGTQNNVIRKLTLSNEIDLLLAVNRPDLSPCSYGNYLYKKSSWKNAGRYNESLGGAYDSFAFGIAQLGTGTKMKTLPGTAYLHRAGYDSTYMREYRKRPISLLYLQILIPFLDQIHPEDVDFMMGEGRLYWAEQLGARPLRANTSGTKQEFNFAMLPEPPVSELFRILLRKVKRKLKGK
ncbi:MAG: glycosyltransferase family 2 protein [Bacteroidia bacterium]|nr:glycosyltransferase family 2 protein [Bacteroidia bacterium]